MRCMIVAVAGILNIFLAVLPLMAIIAFVVVVRLAIRRFWHRRKRPAPVERCKCGYSIENLSIARCPECGRVFGFDATAEELGLTDEQLQRAQAARIQRKESGDCARKPAVDGVGSVEEPA
jgi:hypothetical protein